MIPCRPMYTFTMFFALLFLAASCADDPPSDQNPAPDCSPGECSGNGVCMITSQGDSYCLCDDEYAPKPEFECLFSDTGNTIAVYLLSESLDNAERRILPLPIGYVSDDPAVIMGALEAAGYLYIYGHASFQGFLLRAQL